MAQDNDSIIDRVLASRGALPYVDSGERKAAEEGGCGVTGFIASVPVSGRHIMEPSVQMHNRGNGKGGGIAAVGLSAADLGVSQEVLDSHYLLQVALLDASARSEIETEFITPFLDVHKASEVPHMADYREVKGLEVRPPDVMRYFVRVKPDVLKRFVAENKLSDMDVRNAEDEFISQNSFRLNQKYYSSLVEKRAFVLSHGRDIMILKIVGYAEQVAQYYRLEDFKAYGWIAHQRYPTKGRVWHPGGAHPFIGMDEALVHNGDFANYYAITEYLKQFNIRQQFLTDTEVSVQLFDLWNRVFGYPLEYIIEAMAPTSEYDFDQLLPEKQHIYKHIQSTHLPASPDGPWFFIIARNNPYKHYHQLIGITDTSMLRPQVFALQEGEVQIGFICSEKQSIDAALESLSREDHRFRPIADKYWNARGGSATDGGAFVFTVRDSGRGDGSKILSCANKFGESVTVPPGQRAFKAPSDYDAPVSRQAISQAVRSALAAADNSELLSYFVRNMNKWNYASLIFLSSELVTVGQESDKARAAAIDILTSLNDRRYTTGDKKRSSVLQIIRDALHRLLDAVPGFNTDSVGKYRRLNFAGRGTLGAPIGNEKVLVIDARDFPPEGEDCDARYIVAAFQQGWRSFICYGYRGQRFTGCGLGKETDGVRIDVYDSSGDYLASGIDGMEIRVHGNAQDQLGQIMKRGKLVVYGDVGQTFMYGAKGGEVYIMGNAAGRPLINAVGRPRVVINGTCLDFLAESFMAGDPLKGGGFVILNGMEFDEKSGQVKELNSPYPGSNLFSLASGGAIYVRDPHGKVVDEQLNGGEIATPSQADWELILPYLAENEKLFGISVENDLLTVKGERKLYSEVYRKVQPLKSTVLAGSKTSTVKEKIISLAD
ncbi:MAG: glutamate synthase [Dehalococcoidia bacterium]|nr:MAG: glutamate synthase [Dehalococcoidia bacterium]